VDGRRRAAHAGDRRARLARAPRVGVGAQGPRNAPALQDRHQREEADAIRKRLLGRRTPGLDRVEGSGPGAVRDRGLRPRRVRRAGRLAPRSTNRKSSREAGERLRRPARAEPSGSRAAHEASHVLRSTPTGREATQQLGSMLRRDQRHPRARTAGAGPPADDPAADRAQSFVLDTAGKCGLLNRCSLLSAADAEADEPRVPGTGRPFGPPSMEEVEGIEAGTDGEGRPRLRARVRRRLLLSRSDAVRGARHAEADRPRDRRLAARSGR